jgi:predicted kinase
MNEEVKLLLMKRPMLFVLCGPPGCGKSTWAARRFWPSQIVSTDALRVALTDDANSMDQNDYVFEIYHRIIEIRLAVGHTAVADATQLWPPLTPRAKLLKIAREHQAFAILVVFDVSLEFCLENNSRRERRLDEDVIKLYCERFQLQRSEFNYEGFDHVYWLNEAYLAARR